MSMQDPLSDMLTRIRNAGSAGHQSVEMSASKLKLAVVNALIDEGYVKSVEVMDSDSRKPTMRVFIKYHMGSHVIARIARVSRCGLRVYKRMRDLPRVMGGLGTAIISTSKGIMSDRAARKAGLGGEILCVVE